MTTFPTSKNSGKSPLVLLPTDHTLLKRVAKSIPDLYDPAFQEFIDELMHCGEENQGVGIAAPQVGHSWRLFIMASKPNARYPDAPLMEPTAILHPRILALSPETVDGWEGCLSVPGLRGEVARSLEVEATWFDRRGIMHHGKLSGFLARLFQHEYDHLEGILYPERMRPGMKTISLEEYADLMAKDRTHPSQP